MAIDYEAEVDELEPDLDGADEESAPDEVDGFQADDAPPEDTTPDPVAALGERLGQIESVVSRLGDFDPNSVRRDLGQIRTLQSALSQLEKRDPTGALAPQIEALEDVLSGITDALAASDLLDERSKSSVMTARQQLANRRAGREWDTLKNDLIKELRPEEKQETQPEQDSAQAIAIEAATARVTGYAEAKGVDPKTIPDGEWFLRPGEDLAAATKRVLAVVDGLVDEDSATERTAARRRAAGAGTPSKQGASNDPEDILRRYAEGDPSVSAQDAEKALQAGGYR